mgnify:CR=1 FL=1
MTWTLIEGQGEPDYAGSRSLGDSSLNESVRELSAFHLGLTPLDTQRRVTVMTVISIIDLSHDSFWRAFPVFNANSSQACQQANGVTPSPFEPDLSFLRHHAQRSVVAQTCEGRSSRAAVRGARAHRAKASERR